MSTVPQRRGAGPPVTHPGSARRPGPTSAGSRPRYGGIPAIGIDIASVERVAATLGRRPGIAERCFTAAERADCEGRPERWASRWAAKEAVRKLAGRLGARPLPAFADIEVGRDARGAPTVRVTGWPQPPAISLSHDAGVAAAVAIMVGGVPGPDGRPALEPPDGLCLPERPRGGHKGTFGTVVVVAGAHGFGGAAYLCAMGAARGGAGLVRLCVPAALYPVMAARCTEVMPHGLPDGGAGVLVPAAVAVLAADHLTAATVVVLGPGLGRARETREAVLELIAALTCPAVVDADGLNAVAGESQPWTRSRHPIVVTPHPAEMGRLAGVSTAAVQADREGVARRYAAENGVVVVLKGAGTLVAAPDGRLARDGHATPALATGGTGDVLAGLCGAMIAGGLEPFEAARAAVAVHGEAGMAVEATLGRAGGLASDLLAALPAAQERLRRALEARSPR